MISVAAGVIALLTAVRLWRSARMPTAVLALVVAGMVGNLADRTTRGHVRDWLVIAPSVGTWRTSISQSPSSG